MAENNRPNPDLQPEDRPTGTPEEPKHYATRSQRIAAWIAVVGMVIIVLMYTYSIATGAILLW